MSDTEVVSALRLIVPRAQHELPPPDVTLLTQRITVEMTENLTITHAHDGEGDPWVQEVYGAWNPDKSLIRIDAGMGFERQRETFLHENLHAILEVSQVERMLSGASLPNEAVVAALTPVLLAWLRENPVALAYLTERNPL